ncbi:hypothetical protein HPB52_007516 [Rhipicephalus sanguineus]|uniref:CKK domain-containing protein n=1 Tax=Rhipicephalus sanguineus TaxID=34632 RepID=A0A9D4SSP1_RHISA|nr:hypothetical protein HPB52_007516 [Rhipicephalus sanguineus]
MAGVEGAPEPGAPELREVFYRDQAEQDRLRPQLVQALASGELYCLALANIYADPNYHSLSHQGVVQALQRKGVDVEPPADHTPLTETVLAQTAPLRMSAHMAVINGIMELYIKEVLIPIKVFEVLSDTGGGSRRRGGCGALWFEQVLCEKRHRIEDELGPDSACRGPPMLQDLADLSDGCALAALLSFYCPQHCPGTTVPAGRQLADSLYNLQLSQRFCDAHLRMTCSSCTVEDVLFVHPSIRQNLLALSPISSARHRGESLRKARALQNSCSHIPDLCPPDDHNQTKHNGAWPEGVRRLSQGAKPVTRVSRSSAREDEDSDQLSSSPRCRSDEDDAFLSNRRPSSSLRRHSSEAMDPLLPARLREPKERNNCDVAKYLERGEDASLGSSPTPQSPARSLHEAMHRVREAEEQGSPAHRASSISGNLSLRRSTSRSAGISPSSEWVAQHPSSASKSDVGSPLRRNSSRTDLFQPSALSRSTSQTDIYGGSPVRRTTSRLASESETKKPSTLETYYDQLGGGLQKQAGYPLRRESSLSHMYNFLTDMFRRTQGTNKEGSSDYKFCAAIENEGYHRLWQGTVKHQHCLHAAGWLWESVASRKAEDNANRRPVSRHRRQPRGQQAAADSEENRSTEDSSSPLAAQLNNVRLKLEERRRKIEQEKRRMEDRVKRQRQKQSLRRWWQHARVVWRTLTEDAFADSVDSELPQQKWLQQNGSPQPVEESPQSDDADISRITKQQQAIQNLLHGPQAMPLQPQPQENSSCTVTMMVGSLRACPHLRTLPPTLPHRAAKEGSGALLWSHLRSNPCAGGPQLLHWWTRATWSIPQARTNLRTSRLTTKMVPLPPCSNACRGGAACRSLENLSMGSLASQPRSVEFGKTYRVSKSQQPARNQTKPADEGSEAGFFISFDDQQPKNQSRSSVQESQSRSLGSAMVPSRRHLQEAQKALRTHQTAPIREPRTSHGPLGVGFVIGADLVNPDPEAETEMQRRKEMMMLVSLRRREEQEAARVAKEQRNAVKRMQEQLRREEQARKREEDRQRRQMILEQYRQRKAQEEAEKDAAVHGGSSMSLRGGDGGATLTRSSAKPRSSSRPRPKSVHLGPCSLQRGSHTSLDECGRQRAASPPPSGTEWRTSASDGASDTASTHSLMLLPSASEYAGPKLFVKPTAKSNRSIIINAINTVLAGAVNSETKRKVLEEINVSESKHFLILFRDSGCQFRGLYSYHPEREEVLRLHGIGPRSVLPSMMDMFFKYNSGAKSFTQIHTKHLTVTIDAFTIHNHLWTVKKTCVPQRRDL